MELEELKATVQENKTNEGSVGQTNVRLDATTVQEAKQALGVSQNTELAPFVESAIYQAIGEEDKAEDKIEAFEKQFTEE